MILDLLLEMSLKQVQADFKWDQIFILKKLKKKKFLIYFYCYFFFSFWVYSFSTT
jgi:hypothetical protein